MIPLSLASKHIPYFVVKIPKDPICDISNQINIIKGLLLTIQDNSSEMVTVESNDMQYSVEKKQANQIFVSPALEHQDVIFGGNKTKPREIILSVIGSFKGHFSLIECVKAVQQKDSKIGEITVYRALKVLVEKSIIEEVELPDGTKKMELLKGHHDHIICKNCGNIIEFHNTKIEELQQNIAKENRVKLVSHTMTLVASECTKCVK